MSARHLAVLERFPHHLAASEEGKRLGHVVGALTAALDVLTRQLGDVRRAHRLAEAPTVLDLVALAGLHGLGEPDLQLVRTRLRALAATAAGDPPVADPAAVAPLVGVPAPVLAGFGEGASGLPAAMARATRHDAGLELSRALVRDVVAASVVGNGTSTALLAAASAYLGLELDEVVHSEDRWWHLARARDRVRLVPPAAEAGPAPAAPLPEPDLLALEENPFRPADVEPVPRRHGEQFRLVRGGLEDVDVSVRVRGLGRRSVRPVVVQVDSGRGLAFEGTVPHDVELRFAASGRVTLGTTDVTGSSWAFAGAVFGSATARRPGRDFVFAGGPDDPRSGDRLARFVQTAPLADVLDVSAPLPHGTAAVGPLPLPVGESRWAAFVRAAHAGGAVPPGPRTKQARFDAAVLADVADRDGVRVGEASLAVGFSWEERQPFAVRVVLPRRLAAVDDEAGSRVRQPLRRLLDRHRAAGVDLRVDYADPRWTLGSGVVRETGDEAVGTVLAGTELWPDGTAQPVQ